MDNPAATLRQLHVYNRIIHSACSRGRLKCDKVELILGKIRTPADRFRPGIHGLKPDQRFAGLKDGL